MTIKRTSLDSSWKEWITLNLSRRVPVEYLVRDMVKNDFDESFARTAIQDMASYPRLTPLWDGADNIDVGGGHIVKIAGRLESPEVMLLENLLTIEECDELITFAVPCMAPASVVDSQNGAHVPHKDRVSDTAFIQDKASPLMQKLAERASVVMQVSATHGEDFQVVHYRPGGEYKAHYDYFPPGVAGSQTHLASGGNRQSTLIFYLNDVESGGSTSFPLVNFSVPARKGHGLFFRFSDSAGHLDGQSMHSGDPVFLGEKWIMTKWMRERPRQ